MLIKFKGVEVGSQQKVNTQTNFAFLEQGESQLARLGMLSEKYFPDDPNTSLLKLRQYGELLAQRVAAYVGLYTAYDETQHALLNRLYNEQIISFQVKQLFNELRKAGNEANHEFKGDYRIALAHIRYAWQFRYLVSSNIQR